MIISVWRYSHLLLAVSSFIFLTLASVTGIALAVDPVTSKMLDYRVADLDRVSLAQTIPVLKKKYNDLQKLSVDDNDFVILEWTNDDGQSQQSYIDPANGKVLGPVEKQSAFFQWMTSLHRSLFLHNTGRLIMAITAFLLILITVSGIILVVQRQKGFRRFFARIERDHFAQYYHIVFGRIVLVPILIIALTGTIISMSRLELINTKQPSLQVDLDHLKTGPAVELKNSETFRQIPLSELQELEFPFSEDVEDYYTVKLSDRELAVNQLTGEILNQQRYPAGARLNALAMRLHTGRSGSIWAIILAISCGYILFFICSGFVIMFRRRANRSVNRFKPDESRVVILVGSESGTTMRFAKSVQQQLMQQGEKVYLTDLDNYHLFPVMEHLIVMTSTYGLGDPPSNARKFQHKLDLCPQHQTVRFSVLAFGSRSYTDFCSFGLEADRWLSRQPWAFRATEVVTVNDRSPEDFGNWCNSWSSETGLTISLTNELLHGAPHDLHRFTVDFKSALSVSDSFLIRLRSVKGPAFRSGDLIAIYPKNDHHERLYSVGRVEGRMQLSVRLHPDGLGSGYLFGLNTGESLQARLVKNRHFYFPKRAPAVILISNGTGIAPFLGMIDENRKKIPTYLYCGFRYQSSFDPYKDFLSQKIATGQLRQVKTALSREDQRIYVTDLIMADSAMLQQQLLSGAVLMICGSLAMQADVLNAIEKIIQGQPGLNMDALLERGRIRTDCY
ncbi:MAG: PepSY domain-containing protein [Chitinophagaceae bacterium]